MVNKNYLLFGEAVVVGAILTAFFWPTPLIASITHHAVGMPPSFGKEGCSGNGCGGTFPSSKAINPPRLPEKPNPRRGTCCTNECVCLDFPGTIKNRTCAINGASPNAALRGCPCVGQPCRLPGDPVLNIKQSNQDISAQNPIQTGIHRLLSGQNIFTGEPILGGARPTEAPLAVP